MSDAPAPIFRRILLKLSGESLMGDLEYGTDLKRLREVAQEIKRVHDRGVEIAIVLGAGNIYRGISGAAEGMDRATADYMGMLAIVLNALQLQDALEKLHVHTRVQSALDIREVAEPYIRDASKTIKELVTALAASVGENVSVRRFQRFALGESA